MMPKRAKNRPAPGTAAVRRIILKHGLPEPCARLMAFLAYGEGAQ